MTRRLLAAALIALIGSLVVVSNGAAIIILNPPATYVVDTNVDQNLTACTSAAGDCSLRGAINDANAYHPTIGTNAIHFAIPALGMPTIQIVNGSLPDVTQRVIIDGTTQSAGRVGIERNRFGTAVHGFRVTGGNTTIEGLAIYGFSTGFGFAIELYTPGGNNVIQNDYIGTPDGIDGSNGNFLGIWVFSDDNTIGGTTAAQRNVISANQSDGVNLETTSGNVVEGNYIGTDKTGASALGNGTDGVLVQNFGGNTIGGTAPGSGNLISGNGMSDPNGSGLRLSNGGNSVFGNLIGTNAAGNAAIGNKVGVVVQASGSGSSIGGASSGEGNVISGNLGDGVDVAAADVTVQGNAIGTNQLGTAAVANGGSGVKVTAGGATIGGTTPVASNLISGNAGAGVLVSQTPTAGLIQGNYIGTNAAGTSEIANTGGGIQVDGASNTTIGGTSGTSPGGSCTGACNLISGNGTAQNTQEAAVSVAGSSNTMIEGNFIGPNVTGTAAVLPNSQTGIDVEDSSNTVIGGTSPAARNLISGNSANGGGAGVSVGDQADDDSGTLIEGNFIGVDTTGANPIGTSAETGQQARGISVEGESNVTVGGTQTGARNIISNSAGYGLVFDTATRTPVNEVVQGNYIGTDVTGTQAIPNGVGLFLNTSNGTIGGPQASARNVISGNSIGVDIDGAPLAESNKVQGNYIGVDSSGTKALPNTMAGLLVRAIAQETVRNNLIGGGAPGEGNVISGNGGDGIDLGDNGAGVNESNGVIGNLIGTDATGTEPLGNASFGIEIHHGSHDNFIQSNVIAANAVGIGVNDQTSTGNDIIQNFIGTNQDGASDLGNSAEGVYVSGSPDTTIGSETAPASGAAAGGNVIANNGAAGVRIEGATAVQDAITGNSIDDNGGRGIELDTGGNENQAAPVLASAVATGSTKVNGALTSTPNKTFHIELFASPVCDSSGSGEGRKFLGATDATTNGAGAATITATVPGNQSGQVITATATDPDGNTSPFSTCMTATGPTPSPTPTATPVPSNGSPTATATPAPPTLGDSNCDGKIDTADVIADLSGVAGVPPGAECPASADVDCDGQLGANDALRTERYIASVPIAQQSGCAQIGSPL